MSNNIYDILKKMHDLEAPKQSLAESKKAKPDYIDIDKDGDKTEPMKKAAREKSKGAVAEAVATVERQLVEKYQGFKKSVAEGVQAKGSIKSTDSGEEYTAAPGYRVSAEFEPGQTKPKMGFVKDKSSDSDQTGQAAKPAKPTEKPADQPKVDEDSVRLMQRGFDPYFGAPSGDLDMGREMGPQDDIELKRYRKENPLPKGPGTTVDDYALDRRNLQAAMLYDKYNRAQQLARDRNDLSLGQWAEKGMNKIKSLVTGKPEQPVSYQAYRFDKPGPFGGATARDEIAPPPMKEGEMDESALQAYLGKKKYGEQGMKALQKAGRDGASKEKMAMIRARHDKMDEDSGKVNREELPGKQPPPIDDRSRQSDKTNFSKANREELPGKQPPTIDNRSRSMKEGEYNEDMLSPKQKKFAALAEPKDKITYADKIAGAKKKTEGNKFSGNLMKARQKGLKRADLDGDGDMEPVREEENKYMNKDGTFKNPRTDAARERQRAEIEQTQKTSDGNWMGPKDKAPKYRPSEYTQGKYSQEIAKAMDQDREERDSARSPLNKIGNYGSRLFFGKDMPVNEGRTSMREGWEEMQKYLEKKRGPESKGGSGKKAGTRYGGSAQRDDDEETDGEGQAVVKKKGRPKGTGGGAKFNFKKPKD